MSKKALLVISFGTSYLETGKKNIEAVENTLQAAYPERVFFRAYTSGMIRAKLKRRDGIDIPSVEEALTQIRDEGFQDLLIQPTHIIPGHEYTDIVHAVKDFAPAFTTVKLGAPLLASEASTGAIAQILGETFSDQVNSGKALVFMGHGSTHEADLLYNALEQTFVRLGRKHIYVGTLDGSVGVKEIIPCLKAGGYSRILLLPFMLVAGDHAQNDMAGSDDGSWKSLLEQAGFEVDCLIQGLGEIPEIRDLYVQRSQAAREI